MPKYRCHRRSLPPAVLSPSELKEIEAALGPEFKGHTQWNFWSSHLNVNNETLDQLLREAADVRGLSDFEIVADRGAESITITGGAEGCFIEYETVPDFEMEIIQRVRAIEGVFRESRRRTGYIPRPFVSAPGLNKLALSPAIKIGQTGFALNIQWQVVLQNAIATWLSYAGTAGIGFAVGIGVGRFT